jgi:cell wall-associated NlpC family hydrolase
MPTRDDVVKLARNALGTPWRHQGRLAGHGLDCVGLLVYVARELELEGGNHSNTNYGHFPDQGRVMYELGEYLDPIEFADVMPGDVALVADDGTHSVHTGILAVDATGALTMIHAAAKNRRVVEQLFDEDLRRKFRRAYRFRGLS